MLVDSRIMFFKMHIKRIKSPECRKSGIKCKMSFLSEPAVLRFSIDQRSSKYRGMSFHSLKLEKENSANLWNTDKKGKQKP